ncbi:PP2C family protein-serine/threonine phosphatase [Streptomyces fradiae]|uniref:PP2C family protein-serine/threonine phosphatase n=1 Tax=Streptomyces fradiae TaxID=1906 RepID=UPI0034092990
MDRVPRELPGARAPHWLRALPWALLVVVETAQFLTPETVQLGFVFAVLPMLASLAYGMAGTLLVSTAIMLLLALPEARAEHISSGDLLALGLIGAVSTLLAWVRGRRNAQLVTVRTVAEAAQYAVLPPLPPRVGPVRCGALYQAAVHTALVGGDLYDVQPGPYGVRAVVADVKGHGLGAVSTVAALLGAFREAVLDEPELAGVAARMDRRLVVDAARREDEELFATALLLEFPTRGGGGRGAGEGAEPLAGTGGGPGGAGAEALAGTGGGPGGAGAEALAGTGGGPGGAGAEAGRGAEAGGADVVGGPGGAGAEAGGPGGGGPRPDGGPPVEARLLSCGHPPPFVVGRAGAREVAMESGPPLGLGLTRSAAPEPLTVALEPSCVLLAYTDGVTEARDASGRFYPLGERVRPEREPVALVRAVWRDLSAYTGEIADDVALLALRVDPGE